MCTYFARFTLFTLFTLFNTIHTIGIHTYKYYSCDIVGLLNNGQLDRGEAGGVEVRVERLHVEMCITPLRFATAAAAAIALCVGVEVSVDEDIMEILLHLEKGTGGDGDGDSKS